MGQLRTSVIVWVLGEGTTTTKINLNLQPQLVHSLKTCYYLIHIRQSNRTLNI